MSVAAGGFAGWPFGFLRDRQMPLAVIFAALSALALPSILLVLGLRPRNTDTR